MRIYHYTTGVAEKQIEKEGFLRPQSHDGDPIREHPIVWFSAHTFFEPMCILRSPFIPVTQPLSVYKMSGLVDGIYRYGLDDENLDLMVELQMNSWDIIKIISNMSKERRADMAVEGRLRGSRTSQWYGTILDAVPISKLTKEKLDFTTGVGQWRWTQTQ